ncbi:site-2 protease family protein [Paenibacillus eucommiae]|uniref:Zn-dependent protease n=1 Tax=Paenibacillus eucommiae TaxID=1355755 RepID=A0ABS4J0Z3_9BACL|nr:site-2 protease family protein [Paenibacillus eucommiae]MBP1993504.1 Zn-dependent protease [Paenibacillus eucommiae]
MDQRKTTNKRNPLWFLGALGIFLLTQAKLIIPLLKFGKVGGAVISMFVTIGAYALIAPWSFAIGLVVMILIHEMGHVAAAKYKKLPVSAPVFIPFLGALITMKRNPRDSVTEAFIAFGGPLIGTLGAVAAFYLGLSIDSRLMISIAYIGFLLNLINLLPIHPLDGGRISTAVTRWLWLLGLLGGLVVIIYLKSILFFIIWATFAWDMYKKFVKYRKREQILTTNARFELPAEHLLQQGFFIPGENHRRELTFTTYSDLKGETEGVQTIDMAWEALDFHQKVQVPRPILVKKVQVVKVEQLHKDNELYLGIQVQIDYTPYENDNYYEVPTATRWKYGSAYLALALFLGFMINEVHKVQLQWS